MKKSNWILSCFLALASFFASCKKEKQDLSRQLIGTWKGTADPYANAAPFEITFAENGTVTYLKWGSLGAGLSGSGSSWSVNGNSLSFHIEASGLGGLDKADGTGTINGSTVTGSFTNTHIYSSTVISTGTFTLVKQ